MAKSKFNETRGWAVAGAAVIAVTAFSAFVFGTPFGSLYSLQKSFISLFPAFIMFSIAGAFAWASLVKHRLKPTAAGMLKKFVFLLALSPFLFLLLLQVLSGRFVGASYSLPVVLPQMLVVSLAVAAVSFRMRKEQIIPKPFVVRTLVMFVLFSGVLAAMDIFIFNTGF
ncbi:hypothetical protein KKH30_04395 [Candidatus Micrarchaeota archaeon]|nr:hypothetical protein [Candidatus Micrarchaeota archaeon]MBU1939979.1 hypothetical protein [Candidatus Micrarchaeota archaeon]